MLKSYSAHQHIQHAFLIVRTSFQAYDKPAFDKTPYPTMPTSNLVQLVVATLIAILSIIVIGVDIKLIDENRLWHHQGNFPVRDLSNVAER